jgi:hypothetical protein
MKLSDLKDYSVVSDPTVSASTSAPAKLSDLKGNFNVVQDAPTKPNYFQRVASEYQKAGQDITKGIETGAETYRQGVDQNSFGGELKATGGLIRSGLRTAGGVASAAFAPITELPLVRSLIGKISGRIMGLPGVEDVVKNATAIAEKYPETAKDIQNIVDIATLGGGAAAEKPVIAEGKAISKDLVQGTKSFLTPSEEAVSSKIQSLFQKSIKPTAKKTIGQADAYKEDVLSAMKTIKDNAQNLNLEDATGEIITGRAPRSLNELAQAVDQTKKSVFDQYDALAKQAGKSGAVIDTHSIASELDNVAKNRAIQIANPKVIEYAQGWAERLRGFDKLDAETTQEVIKIMNNNLKAFYARPSYETASQAAVDAGIANNFREALDKAIEGATGKEYQALKNQYGSLKAIENDVVRASMRDARKNVKGLLDYSDIFTSGQMIGGILSLNPAMVAKGAAERGIKEYLSFLNNPNRAVSNIFDALDRQTGRTFTPESATGKFVKDYIDNPKLGASIEAINPENIAKYVDGEDLKIIRSIVEGNDLNAYIKAQPMLKAMGIQGMDHETEKRFLKEVLDLSTRKVEVKSAPTYLKGEKGRFNGSSSNQ